MKSLWLLSALVLAPACMTSGDRAVTGNCPDGETCSPDTPNGLLFQGMPFADGFQIDGPQPIAVGGRQQISLHLNETTTPDLTLPFQAVGGASVSVNGTLGNSVLLNGDAEGSNLLRITDDDGELYDRTTVEAKPITSVALAILGGTADAPVLYAAAPLHLVIQLFDGSDRLVDLDMQLDWEDQFERPSWDAIDIEPAVGDHAIAVTAGSRPMTSLAFSVVDHVDDILVQNQVDSLPFNVETMVCFAAMNGTTSVAGVPWASTVTSGNAAAERFGDNCFLITPTSHDTVVLSLTALDQVRVFDFAITDGAARIAPAKRGPAPRPTVGERAAAQ